VSTFRDVLAEESKVVSATSDSGAFQDRPATTGPAPEETYGLAFSGGGIRSATFNLGILQGLAQAKLLPKMKYISTVSGGGYIGAWLISWIKRAPRGVVEVQEKLGDYENHRDQGGGVAEPRQVNFLRDYSNYMTPRVGLVGADTWTGVATYQRNVLLNQCILIPFLGTLVFLPWLLGSAAIWLEPFAQHFHGVRVTVAVAFLLLLLALVMASRYSACASVTARVTQPTAGASVTDNEQGASQARVTGLVAAPLFASAVFAGFAFWLWPAAQKQPFWLWAIVGGFVYCLCQIFGLPGRYYVLRSAKQQSKLSRAQLFGIPVTAFVSGAVGGLFLRICHQAIAQWNAWGSSQGSAWHVVAWGPPILVVSFLLVGTLHIGLLKLIIGPEEQEWWGRLGGLLMLGVLAWVAIFGLAIFAPWIAETESHWVKTKTGLLLGWIATTIFGLLSGKSSHTSGGAGAQVAGSSAKNSSSMEVIAAIAPYIFIVGTLCLLSLGVHALIVWQIAPTVVGYWSKVSAIPPFWPVVAMVVLGSVAAILACRVDINIFSMNLLYRNRLIRCYLGASRNVGERQPNRFTGFDPADDLLLTEFDGSIARTEHPELPAYKGPYPIICAALNVTHGERLAWQERKAESFAFTPRFCGYEYPEMKYEPNPAPQGTYRTTDKYAYPQNSRSALHLEAGGVHLGTAVSISGAAASPNMGFHTSPPLAFLMTLFDVRLGWWLPNPRYDNDQLSGNRTEGGPQWSLLYLLKELLASTTDESKYVYLSDGGHFENLAVYELVRRRCKYIIACDADADAGMTFGDLGNAIRKCRSDFGVEITIDPTPIQLPLGGFARAHGVVGEVRYPNTSTEDGFVGEILYIKPTLSVDTPRDVLAYRAGHPEFPDQSTADQWFDESQFESYRRLGLYTMQKLAGMPDNAPQDPPLPVRELFRRVQAVNNDPEIARPS
jgi:hypothetical protein